MPSDPIMAAITTSGSKVAGSEFTLTCTVSERYSGLTTMPAAVWLRHDPHLNRIVPVVSGNGIAIATPPPGDRTAVSTMLINPLKISHSGEHFCIGTITTLLHAQERVTIPWDLKVQSKAMVIQ